MKSLFRKIRNTVEDFLGIAVRAFLALFPRNRNLLVFGAWAGERYDDNARALFEYCLSNRPDLRCIWHTRSRAVFEEMSRAGLPVCRIRSFRAIRNILRAKYIICTDSALDYGWDVCTGGATVVNLWHGSGPKMSVYEVNPLPTPLGQYMAKLRRRLSHYRYVTTSEEMVTRYTRLFNYDREYILNLGQGRNDLFYTPHTNPLREAYPLKRIVVYMPTFREEGKKRIPIDLGSIIDLSALDELCGRENMVFLVKFHQWTPGHLEGDYRNIIELKDGSLRVQMILDAADVFITDYSSCFVDHLLLDRPQILFAYDLDRYLRDERHLYGDYLADATGPVCRDGASLLSELEDIAHGADGYAAARHKMLDRYYSICNRGPVLQKQLETILSM